MSDLIERLKATALDKDNFPRMDSEKACSVGLALEAAAALITERQRAIYDEDYVRNLERELAAAREDALVIYDGYAVYTELSEPAKRHTSAGNVNDVLDAIARIWKKSDAARKG